MGNHADPRFTNADAEIIKHKVRKLIGRYGFNASDEPDLQQELAMHVSTRMARHDPARGARSTFVDRIVRNKIANILESRMALKRGGRKRPLALDAVPEGLLLDGQTDAHAVDLGMDVGSAVSALPPELREVAIRLAKHSPSEVARMLGLTRGQMRQRMEAIRVHLEGAGVSPHPPDEQPTRLRSR